MSIVRGVEVAFAVVVLVATVVAVAVVVVAVVVLALVGVLVVVVVPAVIAAAAAAVVGCIIALVRTGSTLEDLGASTLNKEKMSANVRVFISSFLKLVEQSSNHLHQQGQQMPVPSLL